MTDKKKIVTVLGGIVLTANNWPEKKLKIYPGDFTVWAEDSNPRGRCFLRDPVRNSPERRARGGVFYLNTMTSRENFYIELFNAGISSRKKRYAVFTAESENPAKDNYFRQIRLVSNYALRDYYEALDAEECEDFPPQVCGAGEAMWRFMGQEVSSCNIGKRTACKEFDGEMIIGRIRFGLTVERSVKVLDGRGNSDLDSVIRMWSQPYYPELPV